MQHFEGDIIATYLNSKTTVRKREEMLRGRQSVYTLDSVHARVAVPTSGAYRIKAANDMKAQKIVAVSASEWPSFIKEGSRFTNIPDLIKDDSMAALIVNTIGGFNPVDLSDSEFKSNIWFGNKEQAYDYAERLAKRYQMKRKQITKVDLRTQEKWPETKPGTHNVGVASFVFDNRRREVLAVLGIEEQSVELHVSAALVSPRQVVQSIFVDYMVEKGKTIGIELSVVVLEKEAESNVNSVGVITVFPEQIGAIRLVFVTGVVKSTRNFFF